MKIIEQGKFADVPFDERAKKLRMWNIVRFRFGEEPVHESVLDKLQFFHYFVVEDNLSAYPMRTDFPGWKHVGNHERIGRSYWNCFKARHPGSTLLFHDAPDFSGELNGVPFWGDIGVVGGFTFSLTLSEMPQNSLWISVTEHRQIILEPLVDMQRYIELVCDDSPDALEKFCFGDAFTTL